MSKVSDLHKKWGRDPDYQAAYYHSGKALERLGHSAQAGETYRRGIEVARRSGDLHACSELEAALEELGS